MVLLSVWHLLAPLILIIDHLEILVWRDRGKSPTQPCAGSRISGEVRTGHSGLDPVWWNLWGWRWHHLCGQPLSWLNCSHGGNRLVWCFLISILNHFLQLVLCSSGKIMALFPWHIGRLPGGCSRAFSEWAVFPSLLPGHPAGPQIFDKADCLGMGFGRVILCHDVVLEEFLLLRISVSGHPQQRAKVVPETVLW